MCYISIIIKITCPIINKKKKRRGRRRRRRKERGRGRRGRRERGERKEEKKKEIWKAERGRERIRSGRFLREMLMVCFPERLE